MQPTLRTRSLLLRPADPADVDRRAALGATSPEILKLYGVSADAAASFSRAEAEAWVQRLMNNPYAWVIVRDETLLGEARLDRVDLTDRRASFAIGLLDVATLGRGIGTEAAAEVLRFAFADLGLHRLSLRVLEFNVRAIRLYEKLGFRLEGREREAAFIDGKWHDDLMMGILDREFDFQSLTANITASATPTPRNTHQ